MRYGKDLNLGSNVTIEDGVLLGSNITLGDNVIIGYRDIRPGKKTDIESLPTK